MKHVFDSYFMFSLPIKRRQWWQKWNISDDKNTILVLTFLIHSDMI